MASKLSESSRARGWCGTINNPTDDDYYRVFNVSCKYCVYQTEKGDNGTPHIQFYVYFMNAKSFKKMKKAFPRAHLIIAIGTAAQNKVYCQKVKSRITGPAGERGTMPIQGTRIDLDAMMVDVLDLSNVEMMERYPMGWARYHGILKRYREEKRPGRTVMTVVHTFYGPTGTGKSYRAHLEAQIIDPDYAVFMVSDGKTFWADGCEGRDAIVIEDFDGKAIPYRVILQMLDKYKCKMPIKCGSTNWAPKHIFITSNDKPDIWYPEKDYGPLKRRLTTAPSFIAKMTTVYIDTEHTVDPGPYDSLASITEYQPADIKFPEFPALPKFGHNVRTNLAQTNVDEVVENLYTDEPLHPITEYDSDYFIGDSSDEDPISNGAVISREDSIARYGFDYNREREESVFKNTRKE